MVTDVSAFVGQYAYRHLADPTPAALLRQMDRLGIDRSWVGHLPSALHRDPRPGTLELERVLEGHRDRLVAVPTIHPGLPEWEEDISGAVSRGAPAVRAYPTQQSLEPAGGEMQAAAARLAAEQLPLILTVCFEDARQRQSINGAEDLPPWAVRSLVRKNPRLKVLVTHAGRSFVEEVHFGLTPDDAARVLWDIAWIWGPPENHLERLLAAVGLDRFTLGTAMLLRIPDAAFAKLDLLDLSRADRAKLLGATLERWRSE